ncbi:unnamed protein product [Caenorhabditis angaria]|uniref:RNA helicase n=1 Tax=Caenorhabditis angaria TaxID=860376 RepID=A0A9P1MYC5_9PELO|nr:unnamed protein product [Caenorhabditis angaria]
MVEQFINDELHSIVGISDRTICQYVHALARKSKNPSELLEKLREAGDFPINSAIQDFAARLMDKMPKQTVAARNRGPTAAELRAQEMSRLNNSVQALEEPGRSRNIRRRQESSGSEDEAPKKAQAQAQAQVSDSDESDIEAIEGKLDEDIKERDALAARLRKKDKEKTRNIAEKKRESNRNATSSIDKIREESRRQYLAKRKDDKLEELKAIVDDDETLFRNEKLTKRERQDMEYRRKVLEYATKHENAQEIMKIKRYHVPSGDKGIPQNVVDEQETIYHGGDGAKWEHEQLLNAIGAGSKKAPKTEDFELLLDEQIDFIQAIQMPGSNEEMAEKKAKNEFEERKKTIEETRKSLPVYAFRDAFIEAVKEHQVLIIEGETGSGKTTQLPQYLYEAGFCSDGKRIGCTQPRRVAAMSVASRVADEVGCKLGSKVGYSIRFEDCTSEKTVLKYMTDGMLLREFLNEPDLSSYSDLQSKIFEPTPPNSRKVVLATNIAETSVTIDGISYVIDPGFSKQNSFDARSGVEHLHVVTISKAAANQRAGRAGRTGPGKCFRLYTAWAFKHELEEQPIPEIQRTNLGNVVLMLKSLGIHDLVHFDFLDPPPQETLVIALEQLYALGALNHRGELTKLGRRMAEFPCDPCMSKMIIASEKYECSEEILTICAMLSCNAAVFYRPKAMVIHADSARKGFWSPAGDHITLMNVYNKWKESGYSQQWCMENFVQHRTMKRARDVRDQLVGLLERVEIELKTSTDTVNIRKAITAGYFYNVSKLDNTGHYKTVKHKHTTHPHPNSCLFEETPRWVVYYELVFTSKEFMREMSEIESSWLLEVAPHYYKGRELEDSTNKKMPKQRGKSAKDLER